MNSKELKGYKGTNRVQSMEESLPVLAKHYNNLYKDVETNETSIGTINDAISDTLSGGIITTDKLNTMTGGTVISTNVKEYNTEVLLTADEIVGTDAGNIGHADGAILVAAKGTGYALELVSAVLIYDYDTAAYGGGADDCTIQIGVNGTQIASTDTITGANLLEASADAILRLGCIATELVLVDNSAISLAGTALTNPGTAAGVLRAHITYRVHTTGL